MRQRRKRIRTRVVAVAVAALVAVPMLLGGAPAHAVTGSWYVVPAYKGTVAKAIIGYNKTYEAAGQIWIHKKFGKGKFYVQFKPDPRGPGGWNRGTQNVNVKSGAHQFAWSDNFYAYTTGFKFRICKVRFGRDPCGNAVLIEFAGGVMGGG